MANIIESSTYEPAIHELGVDELVLGGLNGPSNTPLKQLTNRTKWLKDAVDALESGGGPFAYNASAGTLPVGGTDGPGVAGIKRKDYYFVTVPGVVSGVTLQIGDSLIAMVDDADTIAEFIVSQSNAELATPSVIGMVKLVQNILGGSLTDAVLSTAGLITLFAQKASPVFTGTPTVPTPADADNTTKIANTFWVLARLAEEATLRSNADSAESTARGNADTTLQNNINTEATTRGNADTTLQNNINSEATARANGDAAVAALIPTVKFLASRLTLPTVDGSNDRDINATLLPNMKIGFWCHITIDAPASNIGVLSYRLPTLAGGLGGENILRQVDTGYGDGEQGGAAGEPNNSEFSWFCPCPPGHTGRFSLGHYVGSGATAVVEILTYI